MNENYRPKSAVTTSTSSHLPSVVDKSSLRYQRQWNPPLLGELPSGFLRISLNDTQRKLDRSNYLNSTSASQAISSLNVVDSSGSPESMMNSSFLQAKMEENQRNRQISSLNDDPEVAQFLEDERFAILLQNEEFVRELRLNRDFMSTLSEESGIGGSGPGGYS